MADDEDQAPLTWLQRAELRSGAYRLLSLKSVEPEERAYAEAILALLEYAKRVELQNIDLETQLALRTAERDEALMWLDKRVRLRDEEIAELKEKIKSERAAYEHWQQRWIEQASGSNIPLAQIHAMAKNPEVVMVQKPDGLEPASVVWPHELLTVILESLETDEHPWERPGT